jgi:hypothetical protein
MDYRSISLAEAERERERLELDVGELQASNRNPERQLELEKLIEQLRDIERHR